MGRRQPVVLELDGLAYGAVDSALTALATPLDLPGDKYYVVDIPEAIARVATVEAPARYAPLMVRRQLQESGEFNEPVSIIIHWKKSLGPNATSIFYTALPTRQYHQLTDLMARSEESLLPYPLYGVLHGVLRGLKPDGATAVVFQHDRFADVLVGTGREILHANRCVAFDQSEEQIAFLWETVHNELTTVESDLKLKIPRVYYLNWIDSGPPPDWGEGAPRELLHLPGEMVTFDQETHEISLLRAARALSPWTAASPFIEKLSRLARLALPWMNLGFLVLAILLFLGHLYYLGQADRLEVDAKRLETYLTRAQTAALAQTTSTDSNTGLNFLADLDYALSVPSFRTVVETVSAAMAGEMKVDVLRVDYGPQEVAVELFGRIETGFDTAHLQYRTFLNVIQSRGWTVREQQMTTTVTAAQFLVRLARGAR